MADLSTLQLTKEPKWDGRPATFNRYRLELVRFFIRKKVAWAVPDLNEASISLPVVGLRADGNATAFVIIADGIDGTDFEALTGQYDEGKADADKIGMDPARLWDAVMAYGRGAIADQSGPALHDRLYEWKWPSDALYGTFTAQVNQAISDIRGFRKEAEHVADNDYPCTEAMLCRIFRTSMPARFQLEYISYEAITRIHALGTRALADATRFDKSSPPVSTNYALFTKSSPRVIIPRERRFDFAAGKPLAESIWCPNHGWSYHTPEKCYVSRRHGRVSSQQHATQFPTEKSVPHSDNATGATGVNNKPTFQCIKNEDGTFTPVYNVKMSAVSELRVFQSVHAMDLNTAPYHFVDSCADISLCGDVHRMTDVVELNPSTAPFITGTGGLIRATHSGFDPVYIGAYQFQNPCLYSPSNDFNIIATNSLAEFGISTFIDADTSNNQLFLILPFTEATVPEIVPCNQLGKIWYIPKKLPIDPKVLIQQEQTGDVGEQTTSSPSDATTVPGAVLTSAIPLRPKDYRWFRQSIGNPSHIRTMKIAAKLNLQLTQQSPAAHELDLELRLANQSARPLTKVTGATLEPPPKKVFISDTLGANFPPAQSGARYLQTWVDLDKPSELYVTVGANHSALTSWRGFEQFAKDSGQCVHRDMISSGLEIRTDCGTEYRGEFDEQCRLAGIRHSTSTPNKHNSGLQGIIEGANAKCQQRMRASLRLARENFAKYGFEARDFWDYCALYAAKQIRASSQILNDELEYAQFQRSCPAMFGAVGTVTLQPQTAQRQQDQKQLSDRAALGLLLGTVDHKCIMLLTTGSIMTTVDVRFDPNQPLVPEEPVLSTADVSSEFSYFESPLAEPALTDILGTTVSTGDRVSVFWPAEDQTYEGTVGTVNLNNDTYGVFYDDGTAQQHLITQSIPMQLTVLLGATTYRRNSPHEAVQPYLTDTGDIKEAYLLRKLPLPPLLTLPNFSQADAPSLPTSINEALASSFAIYWLYAILFEFHGHIDPIGRAPTFEFTTLSSEGRILKSKWVFTIKFNNDKVVKFKARLCIAGWGLHRGIDYIESYTGTAPIGDLYLLEQYALLLDLHVFEDDLEQAYCQSPMPLSPSGEPVLMHLTEGTRVYEPGTGLQMKAKLVMALYGHPAAGFALARTLHDKLLNRDSGVDCPIPLIQSETQPVIFAAQFPPGDKMYKEKFWVWLNNDNIRCYSSDVAIYTLFRGWLSTVFKITGSGISLKEQQPQTCLGVTLAYELNSVKMSMDGYIQLALTRAGLSDCNPVSTPMIEGFKLSKADGPISEMERQVVIDKINVVFAPALNERDNGQITSYKELINFYGSLVSTLGWISKQIGPIISVAHSILSRAMHCPSVAAFMACKRVYRFLAGHPHMGIVYSTSQRYDWRAGIYPSYYLMADSAFISDATDAKTQGGYIGGLEGLAVSHWSTIKSKRVVTSTMHAETYHGSRACRHACYIQQLMNFLGTNTGEPIKLALDNSSTVLSTAGPIRKFSPATRHFTMDDRFIVQCVEDGTIEVRHVPGDPQQMPPSGDDGFAVDAMTKPLGATLLLHYYQFLHGTPA
jgi:hypothetical protein